MLDGSDPLITNSLDWSASGGYGLTRERRRQILREHVEQSVQKLPEVPEDENVQDYVGFDDILNTNPVVTTDGNIRSDIDHGRRVKEVRTVVNINSIQRDQLRTETVPRNPNSGLYTREVTNSEGETEIQHYNEFILNYEHDPGPDDVPFQPYFRRANGEDIGKFIFKYPSPNHYEVKLPRVFTNVKSVRLLSTEVPNTLMPISFLNNVISLDIRDEDTGFSIPLNTEETGSPFPFFFFQLTPGNYNLSELITHMEYKLNSEVRQKSVDQFSNLFQVAVNLNTGLISISLNEQQGRNLTFHLRFWLQSINDNPNWPVPQFSNLWYILGFPSPWEVNRDGSDKYVKVRTNLFNRGINPLLGEGSGFEDTIPNIEEYQDIRPTRFPDVQPNKYIYLMIKGLSTIDDIQNADVTRFTEQEIFAKINLPVRPGETAFDTFVSNPKIFTDGPKPHLDRLLITWVDYAGIPADFSNRNHSFALEIVEYIDKLNSADFSSRRGTIDESSFSDTVKYGK